MSEITLSTAEYPELEGMKEGDSIPKITMTGNKVTSAQEGQITVEMGPCEFETENQADKSLRSMTGAPKPGSEGNMQSHDTDY